MWASKPKPFLMTKLVLLSFLLIFSVLTNAQEYSILIKGGHVIDPKNNINEVMDVAILDAKVVAVSKNIDAKKAAQVIDAKGMYVTPGIIDIHSHNFFGTEPDHYLGNGLEALPPDGFTFRAGVTTVVDAGGAGWKTFDAFKTQTIDHAKTRVLSFLNIVGEGMRGGPYEQNLSDMDSKMTAMAVKQHKEIIVGIKVAHYVGGEWDPVDRAVAAGKIANVPVMIDFGGNNPPLSIQELFTKHLRPGDIFTHAFAQLGSREPIVDSQGKIRPFCYRSAKKWNCFRCRAWRWKFSLLSGYPSFKKWFHSEYHQYRSAYRQHERRNEGSAKRYVKVFEHRHEPSAGDCSFDLASREGNSQGRPRSYFDRSSGRRGNFFLAQGEIRIYRFRWV